MIDRRTAINTALSFLDDAVGTPSPNPVQVRLRAAGIQPPPSPMPSPLLPIIPAFEAFDSAQLPDMPSRQRRPAERLGEIDDGYRERDGVLDASDQLEDLSHLALKRLREILEREVVTGEDEKQTKLTLAAAQTVVQTQVKVDEGRLKKRKLDMLPKLLEIIAQEERRLIA